MAQGSTLDISEARKQFNSLDKRLSSDPVIFITRHSKKAFAVVNVEYVGTVLETLEILSGPDALEQLRRSLDDVRNGRVHDHDDIVEELG